MVTMNHAISLPLIVIFSSIAFNSYAQPSLSDQIDAVDAVQRQNETEEIMSQQAYAIHMEQQQKAANALAAKRREAEYNLEKQKNAEASADKKRDQDYIDQLRALDVQEKSLKIQADKARVARENEYIDQELKAKAAETDVVKSKADATRDISSGTKTLLEKTGEADVKSQSSVFR